MAVTETESVAQTAVSGVEADQTRLGDLGWTRARTRSPEAGDRPTQIIIAAGSVGTTKTNKAARRDRDRCRVVR